MSERRLKLRQELRRRECRQSLLAWCIEALAPLSQEPAAHHRLLIRELESLARGKNDRLMVAMPPGSAKSTYASVLFPSWFMAQGRSLSVIGASHTATLAEKFSGRIQALVRDHGAALGYGLASEAKEYWETTTGNEFRAAGVGGPLTGHRADLALVDDPVKSRQDAESETQRDNVWDWYRSVLTTRLKPGGRVVLIMTRWHPDDLAGRLLANERDRWKVLSLPALAETGDPLGREPGTPLWPEWESGSILADKRRTIGEREWAALYQQQPSLQDGAILRREWWQPHDDPPPSRPAEVVISLDTAYTEKEENDATGCTVWYLLPDGPFKSKILLRYAWRERLEFPELVAFVQRTVAQFGLPAVPLRVLVENKASGISVIQELRRRMPALVVHGMDPRRLGDKVARAHAVTALLEGGVVSALSKDGVFRPWADMCIQECAAFPYGSGDDLVDSTTQALRYFRDRGFEFMAEDAPMPKPYRQVLAPY